MKKVASHLQIANTKIANVWLLEDSAGHKFLIDTGHPLERLPLMAALWRAGVRMPGDLTAVLLTHRHSDHAGNAEWLRKRFGARIVCHDHDAGVLAGRVTAPPLCRDEATRAESGKQRFYERWLCAYEDRAPAYCEVDEVYQEGTWKWGFQIIPVPGHTEGSVMLYHEPSATLFSGDAILVGLPLMRNSKKLYLAHPSYSQDVESCHLAVRRYLRHLPPVKILCSGHGPAVDEGEGVERRLLRLLKD